MMIRAFNMTDNKMKIDINIIITIIINIVNKIPNVFK